MHEDMTVCSGSHISSAITTPKLDCNQISFAAHMLTLISGTEEIIIIIPTKNIDVHVRSYQN